jgi:acylphosphatase
MSRCKRCYISGRVQGVFFRASTQQKANALGLSGYASNLSDGRVEVLACGPEASLAELESWLWEGPPAAQVSDVQCEAVDTEAPARFSTD